MYLTVIAWLYVVLMMSAVEAASPQGTVVGALSTFFLYGLLPLSIVIYIMGTPSRRRARLAREAQEAQEARQAQEAALADRQAPDSTDAQTLTANGSVQPDAGGHPSAGLPGNGTGQGAAAPVREKP